DGGPASAAGALGTVPGGSPPPRGRGPQSRSGGAEVRIRFRSRGGPGVPRLLRLPQLRIPQRGPAETRCRRGAAVRLRGAVGRRVLAVRTAVRGRRGVLGSGAAERRRA